MPRRWRGIVASALLLTASGVGASGLAGCGSDDEAASVEVLSTLRPTKAMVARDAGIAFPPSTDGFRAARVGGDLHVSFTIDADDADAFDERSGLHLAAGKRVITHSSPLWELNPSGEISGGASADSAVRRTVPPPPPPPPPPPRHRCARSRVRAQPTRRPSTQLARYPNTGSPSSAIANTQVEPSL